MSKALEDYSIAALAVFEQNAVNRLLTLTEQSFSSQEEAQPALRAIEAVLAAHPRTDHVAFRKRMVWIEQQYETIKADNPELYAPELFEEAKALRIDVREQLSYLPRSEWIT